MPESIGTTRRLRNFLGFYVVSQLQSITNLHTEDVSSMELVFGLWEYCQMTRDGKWMRRSKFGWVLWWILHTPGSKHKFFIGWNGRDVKTFFTVYVLKVTCNTSSIFWDITPCSPLKVNRRFGGTCRFHLQQSSACHLVSRSAYFSTLRMEVKCSSETSVHFQRSARRCIPEERNLHYHRCENLRSYNM
jgi:hypothetical protein